MSVFFIPSRASLFFLSSIIFCYNAQAQYGITPLRGSLSDQPFCQTSLGRENHRFASHQVNAYRIYDFYARQARYHLEHPEDKASLLLPFTGLDGGRQGHWGFTNEREAAAMAREKSEILGSFTERAETDLQVIKSGSAEHPGAFAFDRQGNLREVLLDATVDAPGIEFLLKQKVDTLGMRLEVKGKSYLLGCNPEWVSAEQKSAALFGGVYWHGERVIYRKFLGQGIIFDHPEIVYLGDQAICARHIEWTEASEAVKYQLPTATGVRRDETRVQSIGAGKWHIVAPVPIGFLHHLVTSFSTHQTQLLPSEKGDLLDIGATSQGDRLHVSSWIDESEMLREEIAGYDKHVIPSKFTAGGPRRFEPMVRTTIKRNVDAAMKSSGYELDDVEIPLENPWNAPMNLSGIAFDPEGIAYVCTLTGDVWKVTGLAEGETIVWRRFASGLVQPMGITVVDGKVCLSTAGHIVRLHDEDRNEEAEFMEVINRVALPSGNMRNNGLELDAAGNFYYGNISGIYQLSADGKQVKQIGKGTRNPLGFGKLKDGPYFSDSSEGDRENGTCAMTESEHPDNASLTDLRKRVLFLPRGIDSSPGSRLMLDEPRFGPLGQSMIGLSYSGCNHYMILRDAMNGISQAAMMPLPGDFASGVMRLNINPRDGQLYVVGIDGWGDYAVAEGSFHRVRWTQQQVLLPQSWRAHKNGIHLVFNEKIDAASHQPTAFFVQQWNTIDSLHTYGSADYSVRSPEQIGHDRLFVKNVLQVGPNEIFLEIPDLLPAMFTQVYASLKAVSGNPCTLDLYATIHQLRDDFAAAPASPSEKRTILEIPNKTSNGNTYQIVVEHFNKIAGVQSAPRPVSAEITYRKEELNYAWIRDHLINKQCIMCHAAGTQHDFSSYKGLLAKINRQNPQLSSLHGMIHSQSMPPYPLPTVSPSMQQAVLDWISKGAPE